MTERAARGSSVLLVSQVCVPDPASVGQHMAGLAATLARRQHRVTVFTSASGYENPAIRYPVREHREGVEVRRFRGASFGKGSLGRRVVGGLSFVAQAVVRGLMLRRLDTVVVSTSPPMAPLVGLVLGAVRRARVVFWVMDLNPDQAIALGVVAPGARFARMLEWVNRRLLARAAAVVALDRFMARRLCGKVPAVASRLTVLPPWPLEEALEPVPHDANPFRAAHGLTGRFVVMYSGNHSPANPLGTLLAAAERVQDDPSFAFVFVGGGLGKAEVEASRSPNVQSLPYEPLATLRYSLSAADVHVVSIGDDLVGVVHPSKVYGALAAGRPILLFGPPENHVADLLAEERVGWHVAHGDVAGAVATLRAIRATPRAELEAMGRRARALVETRFRPDALMARLADLVDAA